MKEMLKKILKAGFPVPGVLRPVIRGLYKLGVVTCEGLVFLRKFFFVEPVLRSIATVGKGLRADRLPYIRGKGRLIIGDNVQLSGRSCFYFMYSDKNEECLAQRTQSHTERAQRCAEKEWLWLAVLCEALCDLCASLCQINSV